MDAYFSADVETDGPIPGPYSILSFSLVYAGSYDGRIFRRPTAYDRIFYAELCPISDLYENEALRVNGLDRERLLLEGLNPIAAMSSAASWVRENSAGREPVLVAYPLSFDWTWLYWYFVRFCESGSPFGYSKCFDVKTAVSLKTGLPVSDSGRLGLPDTLKSNHTHTHHAVDDAIAQAEIFANVFEWEGDGGADTREKTRIFK